jgi:Ca2+-binding RTX toxin-like protein
MAVIRYGEAMTSFGDPTDQIHIRSLEPTLATPTLATFTDKNGAAITITGAGLTFSALGVTGGTLTGIEAVAADGGKLITMTGLSAEAAPVIADFLATGSVGLALLDGNDRIFGSTKSDLLLGGGGNDRLFGGGGRDILGGMNGRDQLTGGGAADIFVFAPNKGVDTIMDFEDSGGRRDDFISAAPRFMDKMVMTQEGDDVLLTFGRSGSLLILNQTVAEMGIDDFVGSIPF